MRLASSKIILIFAFPLHAGSEDAADAGAEAVHHLRRGAAVRAAEGDAAPVVRQVDVWRDQLAVLHGELPVANLINLLGS